MGDRLVVRSDGRHRNDRGILSKRLDSVAEENKAGVIASRFALDSVRISITRCEPAPHRVFRNRARDHELQ